MRACTQCGQALWEKRPVRDIYVDMADRDYQRCVAFFLYVNIYVYTCICIHIASGFLFVHVFDVLTCQKNKPSHRPPPLPVA